MPTKIVLRVERSDGTHEQSSFVQDRVLVGRGARCDLQLDEENCAVSRDHLMLELADDECFAVDRNSLNGTRLNWRPLEPGVRTRVKPGDDLRLPGFLLRVVSIEAAVEGAWSAEHAEVLCTDAELARPLGERVLVGRFFLFLLPGFAAHEALRGLVDPAGGEAPERGVAPLLGRGAVKLPGVEMQSGLRFFDLSCLTSDRSVYRPDVDTVRLLVVDLLRPASVVRVEVRRSGALASSHQVELGPAGVALLELPGLLAGRYDAFLEGPDPLARSCSFVVAAYRLSPLAARLVEHHIEGDALSLRLDVGCFGMPHDGEVAIDLIEEGRPVAEAQATAAAGELRASFELRGRGPFSLTVRSLADPSLTASVPLPGSSRGERARVVLSALGAELRISRMPSPGARRVRGLFVTEEPAKPAPFRLDLSDDGRAALVALKEARALWTSQGSPKAASPPATRRCDYHGRLLPGERLELALEGPLSLLLIGAFVEVGGEWMAWEGCALAVQPSRLGVNLVVDPQALSRGQLSVEVLTQRRDAIGQVYLLVKDARLTRDDTPEGGLASQIKRYADALAPRGAGYVRASASLASLLPRPGRPAEGGGEHCYMMSPVAGQRPAEPAPDRSEASKDVLFASLIELRDGAARATVELGPLPREVEVSAFVVSGLDWEERSALARSEPALFVALELPAFVARGEAAVGRLRARSGGGRVELRRDGEPVALLPVEGPDGQPVQALQFAATPGRYRASVRDAETGEQAHDEGEVFEPGKRRQPIKTLRYVPEGEALDVANDASVRSVRVLPSFAAPLRALMDATRALGQGNCEQIAAGVVAACAAYVADALGREEAIAALARGLWDIEKLWVEGEGFRLYPGMSVDRQLSAATARHLLALEPLTQSEARLPIYAQGQLRLAVRRASEALLLQGIPLRPTEPSTCEDLYRALRDRAPGLSADDAARRALALAAGEALARADAVTRRAEKAYAAATLLRSGAPGTLGAAIGLANEVIADLGPYSRFYSTVDSVAALAMLSELDAIKLSPLRSVALDGVERTAAEALAASGSERSVRPLRGGALVEVTRVTVGDWSALAPTFTARVALLSRGQPAPTLRPGDPADLRVTLEEGYTPGDVLWVCLPDALSWVMGGAQVKVFSADFEGKSELTVPLAATGQTVGPEGELAPQSVRVLVRNVYREERAACPEPLAVLVRA